MNSTKLDQLIQKWKEFDSKTTDEQIEILAGSEDLRHIVDGIAVQAKALESLLIESGCESDVI